MAAVDTQTEASRRVRQAVGLEQAPMRDALPAVNPNSPEIKKSWGLAQPAGKQPVIPEQPPEEAAQPDLASVYLKARDGYRGDNKAADAAHPWLYGGGELAAGLAVPVPGGALMKGGSLASKMVRGGLTAGAIGTAVGAGKSEADTVGGVAKDALVSGGLSVPLGAAGAAVGHGLGKLGERFGAKAATAKTEKALADLDELTASTRGKYGAGSQDAYRTLEKIQSDAVNPRLSQASRDAAAAFLDSSEGIALAEQVAKSTMELAPGKMGNLLATRQAYADAPAAAASKTADYFSKSTVTEDILPRAGRYAQRAGAAGVGGALGGPAGVAAGGVVGMAIGAPGTAMANLVQKTPRFTVQANEAGQKLANFGADAIDELAPRLAGQQEGEEPLRSKQMTALERFFSGL
jgi:hypothetical protein